MANRTPCFFLVSTWDFPPPPSGPIRLGSVITSVKTPEQLIHAGPAPTGGDVFSSEQRQFTFSTEKLRAGRFGIFTRFLSVVLGLGVDASLGWKGSDTSLFAFDRLETTQFVPGPGYVQACVDAETVRRYLAKTHYRKPVYIIVGIKTVSGARAKGTRARALVGNLMAEPGGSALIGSAGGAGGGPGVGGSSERRGDVAWESGSDFVLAFRVRRVLVKKDTGEVRREDNYTRGALLELNQEERPAGPALRIVADVEAAPEEEVGFSRENLTDGDDDDGDVVVACAVPQVSQ